MATNISHNRRRDSLTILHLSDLQFGVNHRFAGIEMTGMKNVHDTLLARVKEDLMRLNKEKCISPDMVMVTGDLAEWGMAAEFALARDFIKKLINREHLNLPRARVAIIPGNHDINRKACEAYFNNCDADAIKPVAPWWPKWRHYSEVLFEKFYGDNSRCTFSEEQPWTFFEIADLHVVIVGLNSTMADGHDCQKLDVEPNRELPLHVGYCGEMQLRSAQKWLRSYKNKGWFRIVMVHHNIQPDIALLDGNLQDHKELERLLAPYTNLFLHGHTHEARLGWLDSSCPILGTGSASLKSVKRPDEIPNQYQVIQVSAEKLRVFKRCYFPDQKEWGADARVGDSGLIEKVVQFDSVHRAIGPVKKMPLSNFVDTYLDRVSQSPVLSDSLNLSEKNPLQEGKAIRVSVLFREVFGNDLVSMRQAGSALAMHNLLHEIMSGSSKVAMLLGVAGIGKTTACKQLQARMTGPDKKLGVIPLYLPLLECAANQPFDLFVDRKINEIMGNSCRKGFDELKDESIRRGVKMLLILDGWNEQPPEKLRQIRKFVRLLLVDSNTRILATSRPIISTETAWLGDEIRFFELQKWTDDQLKAYFRSCDRAQALKQLPVTVRQLLKLPFLASLFISEFGVEQSTTLPKNTAELLERVIQGRFSSLQQAKGRNLPAISESVVGKLPKALQSIAYLMTSTSTLQVEVKTVREYFREIPEKTICDVIVHLINSGILRNAGEPLAFHKKGQPVLGERARIAFIHQIFQEFLTAKYIHLKSTKQPRALLPKNPSTDVFWMDVPMYLIESLRTAGTSNAQLKFVRSFLSKKYGVDLLTAARLEGLIEDAAHRDEIKAELIQRLRESLEEPTPYANIIKAFQALGEEGLAAIWACLTETETQIGVYASAEAQNLGYSVHRDFEVPWRRLGRSIYLLGELGDFQVASHIEKLLPQIRSIHLLYHYGEALLTLARQRVLPVNIRKNIARCAKKLERMDLRDPVTEAYACAVLRECECRTSNLAERSQALAAFLKIESDPSDRRFRSGFWRRAHGCEAFAEVARAKDCAKVLMDLFTVEDFVDYGNYTGGDYGAVHSSIMKAIGRSCSRNGMERNYWHPLMQAVFKSKRIAKNGWACNHLERILTNYFDRQTDVSWLRGWKNSKSLGGEAIRVVLTNVLKNCEAS